MGIKLINESTLTSIADAIRAKNNTSAPISVEAFPSAISSIQTGIDVDKVMQTGFSGGDIPQDILSGSYNYIRSGALWGQGISIDIGAVVSTSGFLRYDLSSEAFAGTLITNTASFPINHSFVGKGVFKYCNFQSGIFSFSRGGGGSIREELFKNSRLPYFKVETSASVFSGSIEQEAFANCKSMSYFYIDTGNSSNSIGLNEIGKRTFADCSNLQSFSIIGTANSFRGINDEAFINCSNLSSFSITSVGGLSYIGEKAFYNCRMLGSFSIGINRNPCPASYIGSSAFAGCSNFIVPQYWTSQTYLSIYNNAFESCKLSGTFYFPDSFSRFYGDEIYKNTSGTNLDFYGFRYASSTNCFKYGCKGANLSFSQYGKINFHYFPEGFFENAIINGDRVLNGIYFSNRYPELAGFDKRAFYNASFIQSTILSLGQGAQTIFINDEAFYNCKNLVSISATTYGWPISYYGKRTFYNCSNLQTINMGMFTSQSSKNNCLCVIDDEAFRNCTALTQVAFTTLNYIGESAFYNCLNLSSFYIYGNQVPILGNQSNWSYILPAGGSVTFYVPSSMVSLYQAAPGWSNYFSMSGKSIIGV